MEIKPGKFVVLTYDLYAGAGEPEETLMMRATDEMPDQFVFGVDQNILPSMLKRLEGLKQGDKFDFVLSCEEAFGERNEEHVMELDKEIFMVDGKFDDQTVFEGNTVPMMTSEGYRINGSVLKVTDDKVLMDFNHPLAGENLHYVGTVSSYAMPRKRNFTPAIVAVVVAVTIMAVAVTAVEIAETVVIK